MKNMILIGIGAVVLLVVSVMGYLWYVAQQSPSIMDGGYDAEMQKKQTNASN